MASTDSPLGGSHDRKDPVDTKTPPALDDFGMAIGRDLPRSLKRTQALAARIRRVSSTPPARKAR